MRTLCQMTRLYEHSLEHTAANMVVGAFGGGPPGGEQRAVRPLQLTRLPATAASACPCIAAAS